MSTISRGDLRPIPAFMAGGEGAQFETIAGARSAEGRTAADSVAMLSPHFRAVNSDLVPPWWQRSLPVRQPGASAGVRRQAGTSVGRRRCPQRRRRLPGARDSGCRTSLIRRLVRSIRMSRVRA